MSDAMTEIRNNKALRIQIEQLEQQLIEYKKQVMTPKEARIIVITGGLK